MNLLQVAFWLNFYFKGEIRDIFTENGEYFSENGWGDWRERSVGILWEFVGMNFNFFTF